MFVTATLPIAEVQKDLATDNNNIVLKSFAFLSIVFSSSKLGYSHHSW